MNFLLLSAAFAAVLLVGCGGQKVAQIPVPQVTVASPQIRDVLRYGEFNGTTRAVASVEVRARVSGRLESMEFEPASIVDQDEPLFVIEQDQYRAFRDQAKADVLSAQAELAAARSDEERIQKAIQNNAVSQQDLDAAIARRKRAEAAELAAKARLEKAELDYGYTVVRSPIHGQVSRNLVDVGNLVGSGENTLLTTVNTMDPMYVYFEAPEGVVLNWLQRRREMGFDPQDDTRAVDPDTLKAGDTGTVSIRLSNEPNYTHFGYLDYIDNTVDPTTGTIQLRAVAPNPDMVLFPGLFVRLRVLSGTTPDAVLVDERAVGTDLGGKYVLLIGEGNVVEQRYLTLGPKQDDGMVVVEEGLEGREKYIINGMLRARPGFPVNPVEQEGAS